jgi:hypothetical protein
VLVGLLLAPLPKPKPVPDSDRKKIRESKLKLYVGYPSGSFSSSSSSSSSSCWRTIKGKYDKSHCSHREPIKPKKVAILPNKKSSNLVGENHQTNKLNEYAELLSPYSTALRALNLPLTFKLIG